jgi:hypothetical protein
MKVSEVYMHHIVRLNPTWACKRALVVFTHMYFCEVLDNHVLVFLLIGWNMLCIQLASSSTTTGNIMYLLLFLFLFLFLWSLILFI